MMGPGDNDHEIDGRDDTVETEFEETHDGSHEELDLTEDDEPLPWLESSEYDTEDEGNDTMRMVGFALLALALLAGLIGLIWYVSNRDTDPQLAPDGSTIEAPAGEYKERPENAGGAQVEGTGDRSFQVGEGESGDGRLGADGSNGAGSAATSETNADSAGETPRPGITTRTSGEGKPADSSGSAQTGSSGVGVQVAAYTSRERAVEGWGEIRGQTEALNGFKYRVEQASVDGNTVYRLQAVAGNRAAADKLCAALKSDGVACQVKR